MVRTSNKSKKGTKQMYSELNNFSYSIIFLLLLFFSFCIFKDICSFLVRKNIFFFLQKSDRWCDGWDWPFAKLKTLLTILILPIINEGQIKEKRNQNIFFALKNSGSLMKHQMVDFIQVTKETRCCFRIEECSQGVKI